MRLFVLTVAWGSLCGVALAAELNLTITSGGNAVVVVEPGEIVPYEVTGVLSDTDNEGLSFFIFDLSFDGGALTPVAAPASAPLTHFTPPEGFTNPEGFGGAVIDDALRQVGGSQNTLKSLLMDGPVMTGVGHTPIVLASGTFTAPMVDGTYTLAASEVLGRAIVQGDDGSGEVWNTEWAFDGVATGLEIIVGDPCQTFADCADLDGDDIRDDNCVWWVCTDGQCVGTDIEFADMGGQFGSCQVDGTADGNDRFAALNCFANQNADGSSPYDCESDAPAAFNVDAGGPFGDCNPDGVCDGNDAFAALNAFEGSTSCVCGAGPMPAIEPVVVGEAVLELRPSRKQLRPGDSVDVDVYLTTPVDDLRGYQLHLEASGGTSGELELADISVGRRRDGVFAKQNTWSAFNAATEQMVVGMDGHGVRTQAAAYLGTFTYRAGRDARGLFHVEVCVEETDPSARTFLFATSAARAFRITSAPVNVIVEGQRRNKR